jgi:hypothetical protein
MNHQIEKTSHPEKIASTKRYLWVTLEAPEVIELKRIAMDRDLDEAVTFFINILTPRVRTAALQRGLGQDMFEEDINDEHIPG